MDKPQRTRDQLRIAITTRLALSSACRDGIEVSVFPIDDRGSWNAVGSSNAHADCLRLLTIVVSALQAEFVLAPEAPQPDVGRPRPPLKLPRPHSPKVESFDEVAKKISQVAHSLRENIAAKSSARPSSSPETALPQSQEAESQFEEAGPHPQEAEHKPQEAEPHPQEAEPHPQEAEPHPQEAEPHPQEAGPHPQEAGPHPQEAGPHPQEAGPHPQEVEHQPQEAEQHQEEPQRVAPATVDKTPNVEGFYPEEPSGTLVAPNHTTIDQGRAEFSEFNAKVDDLLTLLRASSEFSGEVRDQLIAEILAGRALLGAPKADPILLERFLANPLKYIVKKRSHTPIGALTVAMLMLLGRLTSQ
jgi:hypothetical protein